MAIVSSLPLISLFFLIPCIPANKPDELATRICRNATDFAFCLDAIYSDPRAPAADRYVLAYIAFGKAYSNATDTRLYITSTMKGKGKGKGNGQEDVQIGLQKCLLEYQAAIQRLEEMLNDLDSETYYGLDKMSLEVGGHPRACENDFLSGSSPMTRRNANLIKLSDICYVVSKLYQYQVSLGF